ncbi:MAG: hypothetical protein Q7S65_05450 [Nanoarchaeota archaeon]|nr:hypothetical protein [Nanoarchaeota archaeon]
MPTIDELVRQRSSLENLLEEAPAKELELAVYDMCIQARAHYLRDMSRELEEILASTPEAQKRQALLDWNESYGHAPAYIFVLNFDPANPVHNQKTFGGKLLQREERPALGRKVDINDEVCFRDMKRVAYEDNAVLVQVDGTVYGTNVELVEINPQRILTERSSTPGTLQEQLGFRQQVNSRHLYSIGASFEMPGTVVYTLGEGGNIRRFEKGGITFSTVRGETPNAGSPP